MFPPLYWADLESTQLNCPGPRRRCALSWGVLL